MCGKTNLHVAHGRGSSKGVQKDYQVGAKGDIRTAVLQFPRVAGLFIEDQCGKTPFKRFPRSDIALPRRILTSRKEKLHTHSQPTSPDL